MTRARRALRALFLPALLVAASCGEDQSGPTDPLLLEPLESAEWFMHEADGQALPAVIAHREVDGQYEETILDIARLQVFANGTYEQRYRVRTLRDGVEVQADAVIDVGTWTARATDYLLTSGTRVRSFTIAPPSDAGVTSREVMVHRPEAGQVVGLYRPFPVGS